MDLEKYGTTPPDKVDKEDIKAQIPKLNEKLGDLQNMLYAERKHAVLIVLQGTDASGKDGTVRNVFAGVNPMGLQVKSFKAPTTEEAEHDFLWRIHKELPGKGHIGIFNRSHYEDILVPTVHKLFDKDVIKARFKQINDFEAMLTAEGTIIVKILLNISKEEQSERFEERMTDPHKRWKFQKGDQQESEFWDDYQKTYVKIIEDCSDPVKWNVIPADKKWYRNYLVLNLLINTLEDLKMSYPNYTTNG